MATAPRSGQCVRCSGSIQAGDEMRRVPAGWLCWTCVVETNGQQRLPCCEERR